MIERHVHHRQPSEWFLANRDDIQPLVILSTSVGDLLVPGASQLARASGDRSRAGFQIHRSHLPLLTVSSAFKFTNAAREHAARPIDQWAARDRKLTDRNVVLRTTQQQAIDYIEPRRGVLLGDDMRAGKGQIVGSKLLGPSGWFAIENAKVGDAIIGSDGCTHKITGVFPRGTLPVFRVTLTDGSSVVVDGEHLWATWSHNDWHRGKAPRILETQKIEKLRDGAGNLQWRIPLVRPIDFDTKTFEIDPYLLGVLLGDGSLSGLSVSFCCGDEDVPHEVAKVLPPMTKLVRGDSKDRAATWHLPGNNRASSPAHALRRLGLMGTRSETKFVPDVYLFSSFEQRLALLQGLLDTDGEYCDGRLAFSSASERLRDAVRFLVESLGGTARIGVRSEPKYTYKGEQRVGQPSYRLSIAMPAGIRPFRARRGYVDRPKFQPARHIESIEPEGEAEVICISVDAPDQLYVTEHCIVTHNTLASLMCHDPARGPCVVVAPKSTRAVWLGWMRRLWPETPIGVAIGKKLDKSIIEKHLIFIHYEIAAQWQALFKIGTLILDEAHYLTNKDSKRSRACVLLASRAEKIIAATGTPIYTHPIDLWNVLGTIAPGAWGDPYSFGWRYCDPQETAYGTTYDGVSNEAELKARLSEVMIRRIWKDIKNDLPPISRSISVAEVDDRIRKRLDVLAAKLRSDRTNAAGNLAIYRRQLSEIKLSTTINEALKIFANGEPQVIWTWHKDLADSITLKLIEKGVPTFKIHGDIPSDKRDLLIDAWRAVPNGALVATMAVAQVGIDLSHAHLATFAELDYTPLVIAQAEMRTFDATRPMSITFVVADHIVDQRMIRSLIGKLGASDPLGLGSAIDAITAIRSMLEGPGDEPDMQRFLDDLLESGIE